MKVLSIKEPYVSLIKEGTKKIETRSWKTNYRGKLYIHASKKKVPNNHKCTYLLKDKNYKYGAIVAQSSLTDCIYMTEEFINDLKKNNPTEYECGEYKVGRYAWVIEDVAPLKTPIYTNGRLGIWNYTED